MKLISRRTPRLAVAVTALAALTAVAAPQGAPVGHLSAPGQSGLHTVLISEPAAGTAAGAPVGRSATTTTGGYKLATSNLIGFTPKGLQVWVTGGTKHAANIASYTKSAVAQWRTLGIPATYKGYGTPKAGEGIITVSEGPDGCIGGTGRVGNTWQQWMSLPSGYKYVYAGRVVICPTLYTYQKWQWAATVRHELGHAAGLGHYDSVYSGHTQVMRSQNAGGISTYQSGDVNGLKFLATNNAKVRGLIPPVGRLENTKINSTNTKISINGWALLKYDLDKSVTLQVTDNGNLLTSVTPTIYRADINKTYDPNSTRQHGFTTLVDWKGGTHKFCVTAVSSVNAAAKTDLGCATWSA